MKRRDFILEVTRQIEENPKNALIGHGIRPQFIQLIGSRPDVSSKLANVLWMLKTAPRMAKGLRAANNFRIKVYKNFPEFNGNGREDLVDFVDQLMPADADTFSADNNTIVVLFKQETINYNMQTLEGAIAEGASVGLKFDTAVKKEYSYPGGFYVVIMWGNSAIRPKEEKIAFKKAKINAKKVARKERNKGIALGKLKKDYSKYRGEIKRKISRLTPGTSRYAPQIGQFRNIASEFGFEGDYQPQQVIQQISRRDRELAYNQQIAREAKADLINSLDSETLKLYNLYRSAIKKGNVNLANLLGNSISKLGYADLLKYDKPIVHSRSGSEIVKEKANLIRSEIRSLEKNIPQLQSKLQELELNYDYSLDPQQIKNQIATNIKATKNEISRTINKLKDLKGREAAYKTLDPRRISTAGQSIKGKIQKMAGAAYEIEELKREAQQYKENYQATVAQIRAKRNKPKNAQIIANDILDYDYNDSQVADYYNTDVLSDEDEDILLSDINWL